MSRVGLLIVLFFISGFAVAQESVSHLPAADEANHPFEDGKDYFSYQEPLTLPPREDNRIPIQFFFDYDCRVCSSAQDIIVKLTAIAWYSANIRWQQPKRVFLRRFFTVCRR